MLKKINFILELILDLFLVLVTILIIIGLYYVYQIKVQDKKYADVFGYTFFQVATGSMSPTIEVGDVVVVKLTKEVEQNDIIVFEESDSIITHRLISIDGDNLITRGDANNSDDKPVELNMVLGKVIKIIPKLGIIREILIQPQVIILLIALMTLFGVAHVYTSKTEEQDNEKEEDK